jgi:esterase/lipase superfamily enzyme
VWKLEFRADPGRHIVLLDTKQHTYQEFYDRVASTIRASKKTEALVFVHGYAVSFEDAVRRSAQLAVDLKFDGAIITYSWPSAAAVEKYPTDESTIEWTAPHLRWFLEDLSRRSGAKAVNLIAHSMGNRALASAMKSMVLESGAASRPRFQQIVMAAPDVDAGVFASLIQTMESAAERITLYASSRDRALQASKKFHTYPRAGEAGPGIIVLPGLDTIDASTVETDFMEHSYFGDSRSVLFDIFELFESHLPPIDRFGLERRTNAAGSYWAFRPYTPY